MQTLGYLGSLSRLNRHRLHHPHGHQVQLQGRRSTSNPQISSRGGPAARFTRRLDGVQSYQNRTRLQASNRSGGKNLATPPIPLPTDRFLPTKKLTYGGSAIVWHSGGGTRWYSSHRRPQAPASAPSVSTPAVCCAATSGGATSSLRRNEGRCRRGTLGRENPCPGGHRRCRRSRRSRCCSPSRQGQLVSRGLFRPF